MMILHLSRVCSRVRVVHRSRAFDDELLYREGSGALVAQDNIATVPFGAIDRGIVFEDVLGGI
jgi:hypothetical protein